MTEVECEMPAVGFWAVHRAMAPLGDAECRNSPAIGNDRYRLRSTVLPYQLSPDRSRLDAGPPRA